MISFVLLYLKLAKCSFDLNLSKDDKIVWWIRKWMFWMVLYAIFNKFIFRINIWILKYSFSRQMLLTITNVKENEKNKRIIYVKRVLKIKEYDYIWIIKVSLIYLDYYIVAVKNWILLFTMWIYINYFNITSLSQLIHNNIRKKPKLFFEWSCYWWMIMFLK